jgi:hypothetical protein
MDEPGYDCLDCSRCTRDLAEYYMVTRAIWRRVRGRLGMLCIGCLEGRLGRRLCRQDFLAVPLNQERRKRSRRLSLRLHAGGGALAEGDP